MIGWRWQRLGLCRALMVPNAHKSVANTAQATAVDLLVTNTICLPVAVVESLALNGSRAVVPGIDHWQQSGTSISDS